MADSKHIDTQLSAETKQAVADVLVTSGGGPSAIHDVTVRALTTHRDPRGTLTELLRADWTDVFGEDMPFAQVYTSTTQAGVARDIDKWHVHQHQTDRFYCVAGRIVVAIADPREDSPTNGALMLVELAAAEDGPSPLMVTIPPHTLHGFVVTSEQPATLLNFPNRIYDAEDEGRTPFTEANVTFPNGEPFDYRTVDAWYRQR
ncbi:MAG: dTDP-4-dehydrorhamnose 3,5-epimerase family protein [Chloroflexota bacterium]|nr:dTDP-4-dehydrorhamnose 3,5-epimerase family protein [Chloroflexota bacterium]